MREFNREKGYNSFYGSNKREFQDAWQRAKGASIAPQSKEEDETNSIYELKQLEKTYYNYYDIIEIRKAVSGKKVFSMRGYESPSSIKSKYDNINKNLKNKQPELLSADEYKTEIKKQKIRLEKEDKQNMELKKIREDEMRKKMPASEPLRVDGSKRIYKKKAGII